jgi:hypothetical protein
MIFLLLWLVSYITVQWEVSKASIYSPTYRGAFLASWGSRKCDIRSSRCYGQAKSKLKLKEDLIPHKEVLVTGKHSNYILVFNDCQIFSRSVIDYLTGK